MGNFVRQKTFVGAQVVADTTADEMEHRRQVLIAA
jgi:hypothetical protein